MVEEEVTPLEPIDGHFTDLFAAQKRPPVWIIDQLIPAGLTIMVGPPKDAFKSTISMACACIVAGFPTTALPADWIRKTRGPVMVFSYEADAGELRETVEKGLGVQGVAEERIIIADEPDTFRLDDEDGVAQLLHWLDERKPALVILDPLANFHTLDEKDASKMIHILTPLRRWAKQHDCGFVVVHHTRKLPGNESTRNYRADDARGTSAIFGLCDAILTITPNADKKYELVIDAKFKRAGGWMKTIMLGAWERLGKQGMENLRESDIMVLKGIAHGFSKRGRLSKHLNLSPKFLEQRLRFLITKKLVKEDGDRLRLVNKRIIEEAA